MIRLQKQQAPNTKTPSPQLEPATLSTRIGLSIEEAIMCGALKPGERINVDKLALQFKVSHIPVREALKRLEAIGILVLEPNKGAHVPELSRNEIKNIFEIRKALEGLAASLAAQRMDRDHKRSLQTQVKRMQEASTSNDFFKLFAADNQFHRILWDLSGNPFLVRSLSILMLPYFGFLAARGYYVHREQPSYVPQVHQEILDALCSGDSARAREVILNVHERSMHWLPTE